MVVRNAQPKMAASILKQPIFGLRLIADGVDVEPIGTRQTEGKRTWAS